MRSNPDTIRRRILAGLDRAGRPLTRIELTAWFLNGAIDRAKIQGELDAMVRSGELIDMGMTLHRTRERWATPRQTYGLPHIIYGVAGRT